MLNKHTETPRKQKEGQQALLFVLAMFFPFLPNHIVFSTLSQGCPATKDGLFANNSCLYPLLIVVNLPFAVLSTLPGKYIFICTDYPFILTFTKHSFTPIPVCSL